MFLAKKEVFQWLKEGKKTIDVRKGKPRTGDVAVFTCGRCTLKMRIVGTRTGSLGEVVREDNFRQVIPSAANLEAALGYLRGIYGDYDGVFTAYTVVR
ncbi:MAG: ASCH domain-containing protein [Candidatus Bathyarchaeia archaeon]|jgi:ASC-1-like (ASCH) protein